MRQANRHHHPTPTPPTVPLSNLRQLLKKKEKLNQFTAEHLD